MPCTLCKGLHFGKHVLWWWCIRVEICGQVGVYPRMKRECSLCWMLTGVQFAWCKRGLWQQQSAWIVSPSLLDWETFNFFVHRSRRPWHSSIGSHPRVFSAVGYNIKLLKTSCIQKSNITSGKSTIEIQRGMVYFVILSHSYLFILNIFYSYPTHIPLNWEQN